MPSLRLCTKLKCLEITLDGTVGTSNIMQVGKLLNTLPSGLASLRFHEAHIIPSADWDWQALRNLKDLKVSFRSYNPEASKLQRTVCASSIFPIFWQLLSPLAPCCQHAVT